MFDTRLDNRKEVVLFGFGRVNSLINLLHVSFLSFIRFEKVFCHIGGHESWKSGESGFGWKTEGSMEVANSVFS